MKQNLEEREGNVIRKGKINSAIMKLKELRNDNGYEVVRCKYEKENILRWVPSV